MSWSRPTTYADGSRMTDLAGFEIQRALMPSAGAEFERLAVLKVEDRDRFRQVKRFSYLDRTIEGATTYRYRVVSFTLDGYFGAPSNVVTVEYDKSHEDPNGSLPTPRR